MILTDNFYQLCVDINEKPLKFWIDNPYSEIILYISHSPVQIKLGWEIHTLRNHKFVILGSLFLRLHFVSQNTIFFFKFVLIRYFDSIFFLNCLFHQKIFLTLAQVAIHVCIYAYVCIFTHTQIYACGNIHAYLVACMHICMCKSLYTNKNKYHFCLLSLGFNVIKYAFFLLTSISSYIFIKILNIFLIANTIQIIGRIN